MTEDIFRLKLYLQVQELKDLVQMPLLEEVYDGQRDRIGQLEDALIHYSVRLQVIEDAHSLTDLLRNSNAFLLHEHIDLMGPCPHPGAADMAHDPPDITVAVIADTSDLASCHDSGRPISISLTDTDGMAPASGGTQTVSRSRAQAAPCIFLSYSSSRTAQAQALMDGHGMAESGFYAVKCAIRTLARTALHERLTTDTFSEHMRLLGICKEKLDGLISAHTDEIARLQGISGTLAKIDPAFHDGTKKACIDACTIDPEAIVLNGDPKTVFEAQDIVNRTVRGYLGTLVNGPVALAVSNALTIEESGLRQALSCILEDLSWLDGAEKEQIRDSIASLAVDDKTYAAPAFAVSYIELAQAGISKDYGTLQEKMGSMLQKALLRYSAAFRDNITRWVDARERIFAARAGGLIKDIQDSLALAVSRHEQSVNDIAASAAYTKLEQMLANANDLTDQAMLTDKEVAS